ncbi:nitrile hydratase subunit beta [Rhizobium laguerreae]|uniref:nitrile hydratase subunit beta n=1 Tax=Rhizobium laguerreae TaxID=1076926 RepID=UPI00103B3855|nr:nitrile hydratase subunit beta [Rhizobium laguerreae]MBY3256392.1 nitrile hydratase subunit beta [Rhizobium laguerreae]MBY3270171.1 nitrile hydratase subunit beta [Rhizobium laguerreae]MBY3285308.1 nitrile hydratase subunit beta [Rhizobium laguerreae]MBY3291280.1 nitrile hydratase subunit beta [Rhizobium laguerreae]MBY3298081.1 nitrile hydratase subunit beta [Rhizobium laguerreae]
MKLQHYLGGLEGLGPVSTETRVFVEAWETRIFGIHTAMMALSSQLPLPATPSAFSSIWTWADLRKGAESLNPFDYFKYRYYEKWLGGISGYFIDNGYITAEELDALTEEYYADPSKAVPTAGDQAIDDRVVQYLVEGDSPKREAEVSFDFTVGDLVSIRNVPTVEHTRLPGFLRGKTGTVETVYDGAYVYLCDTGTDGIGAAMPVYCIRFAPEELWPTNAETNFSLYADLYAHYVESPRAVAAQAA